MNPTVAAAIVVCAIAAAIWSTVRVFAAPRSRASGVPPAMVASIVMAWLATGVGAWATGDPPARPGVFAGYAVVAAVTVPVGWLYSARIPGRRSDIVLFVTFALAAFLCYRTQQVWMNPLSPR